MSGYYKVGRPKYKKRLKKKSKKLISPYRKRGRWSQQDFLKYAGYAYSAYKGYRILRGLVNVEEKYFDTSSTGQTADYDGTLHYLFQPAQGDGDVSRDGDSCKILTSAIRFTCTAHASIDTWIRVIVFWDKQNTISTGADLLETTGSSAAVYSWRDYDKRFHAKVLFDQRYLLTTDEVGGTQYVTKDLNFNIGKHCQFEAGTTTPNTGVLKIMFISDQQTNIPGYSFYARTIFVDN